MVSTLLSECRLRCVVATHSGATPTGRGNAKAVKARRELAGTTCRYSTNTRGLHLLGSSFAVPASTTTTTTTTTRCRATRRFVVKAAELEDLEELELEAMDRMDKALEKLAENLQTVRTGRASAAMLDGVEVDYYGAPTAIKSLASITVQDGSTIVVQAFDKSSLPEIEKAIRESDLGVSPSNDGTVVRINVPQLTAERRKELVKVVAKYGEESKVAVRNIRRDVKKTIDKFQKDGLSEDLCKDKEGDLQTLTDDYVKKIETSIKGKEKEVTQV
jgi:ribosome recycling factor